MAKARLSFRCISEQNEDSGADAPYFVVWVGDHTKPGGASKAFTIRKQAWDDEIDAGDAGSATFDIQQLGLGGLVLVALIEEDFAPDHNGVQTLAQRVTQRMDDWNAGLAAAVNEASGNYANQFRIRFRNTIAGYLDNDDLLATKRFKAPQGLPMSGDGALYQVRLTPA